jgi:apolipoprotein N-acyltransferase
MPARGADRAKVTFARLNLADAAFARFGAVRTSGARRLGAVAAPTADPAATGPRPRGRRWPRPGRPLAAFLARCTAAAGGGVLLYLGFAPRTLWWLALPAFGLLGTAVHGRRARAGFGLGALFGLGFLLPLLRWTGVYVGPVPWLALSGAEAVFVGAAGAGMAAVSRLRGGPVWAAAVWVGAEALRARVPFGGFPWGRVAFGQPDGPLLPVAALGGAPLLSFVTVLAGLALGEAVRRLAGGQVKAATVPALLALAALLAGPVATLVPATGGGAEKTVTIAAVQGNVPRLGLDFNAQRRAVLDNHVRVTEQLAADVAAGRAPRPDVVLWPENASDIDPLRNPDAAAAIDRAARAVGVPIVLGTVLAGDGDTATNSVLVWQPGVGVVDRTDKRRVQPFGEYLPWRSFFRLFSSYADRAGTFVPGTGVGAVDAAGVRLGVAICWEIAFDDLVADSVAAGAQVLDVPSNNATFGLTDMTFQQLAMSRVRAVEHDRAVRVVTTSGVTATITPDGAVTAATSRFVPDVLVGATPLRTTTTLAGRLRTVPEWVLLATGLAAVATAVARGRRRPRAEGDEHG